MTPEPEKARLKPGAAPGPDSWREYHQPFRANEAAFTIAFEFLGVLTEERLNKSGPAITMESDVQVSFADLLAAFDWVNSGSPWENSAFVSRETGAIHWTSTLIDLEEELPEDIEDASVYVRVPHKYDLDLGKGLALRFAEEHLPESYEIAPGFFHRRGAYGRFKDFLEQKGLLQAWYEYEASAVEQALRAWSEEEGLRLKP